MLMMNDMIQSTKDYTYLRSRKRILIQKYFSVIFFIYLRLSLAFSKASVIVDSEHQKNIMIIIMCILLFFYILKIEEIPKDFS